MARSGNGADAPGKSKESADKKGNDTAASVDDKLVAEKAEAAQAKLGALEEDDVFEDFPAEGNCPQVRYVDLEKADVIKTGLKQKLNSA